MDFENVSELMSNLKNIVAYEMSEDGDIGEIIKDVLVEVIKEHVYDAYSPKLYRDDGEEPFKRRRENNGFQDRDNIVIFEEFLDDMLVIDVSNKAVGKFDGERLDEIIISGKGYTWSKSEIYKTQQPRDFITETLKVLERTDIINKALKRKLKEKYGFQVE